MAPKGMKVNGEEEMERNEEVDVVGGRGRQGGRRCGH